MVILIDNYDSFTYNLYHYLGILGANVTVYRNDEKSCTDILSQKPEAIIISPGPCTPSKAGISIDIIKASNGQVPILGVCLGHQSIGQAFGGRVTKATKALHGKITNIHHTNKGVFANLPSPMKATRYHSLILERDTLPNCLEIIAEEKENNQIMGVQHKEHPIFGVQFHPESIETECGIEILRNFLNI